MNYILSPSLLSADFGRMGEQLKILEDCGVNFTHMDVMDGMFVPSISFGMPVLKSLRTQSDFIFDVHLMIEDPERYLVAFKEAGADILTIHAEACRHLDRTLHAIRYLGMKTGVAINPSTPISVLEHILELCDMVLVMSVNPGFGGQSYIPYCTDKIRALRKMVDERGLSVNISVDGGVNLSNVDEVLEAGANVIVAGSAVFAGDIEANTKGFMQKLEDFAAKQTKS